MFALVSGGQCYLKADDVTRPQFEAEGSTPFRYQSARREVTMRHYLSLPPEEVLAACRRNQSRQIDGTQFWAIKIGRAHV